VASVGGEVPGSVVGFCKPTWERANSSRCWVNNERKAIVSWGFIGLERWGSADSVAVRPAAL